MKKIVLLLILVLCCFTGCTDTPPERTWRDDFTVRCKHIEESKFDDPMDAIHAITNGTFVYEQDEYTITNTTNYVCRNVKLVFHVDLVGLEPFDFKKWVGVIKQGETVVESITESWVLMESGYTDFPDGVIFDFDDCELVEIEYEIDE